MATHPTEEDLYPEEDLTPVHEDSSVPFEEDEQFEDASAEAVAAPAKKKPSAFEKLLFKVAATKVQKKTSARTASSDENYQASIFLKQRRRQRDPLTLHRIIRAIRRGVAYMAPWLAALLVPYFASGDDRRTGTGPQWLVSYYQEHLGMLLIPLIPLLLTLIYVGKNYMRTHPPQKKGRARPIPQPALPSVIRRNRDIADIVANLDHIVVRIIYVALFVGAIVLSGFLHPLKVDNFTALSSGDTSAVRSVVLGLIGPLVLYGFVHFRTSAINRSRQSMIGQIYAIARDTLGYPKLTQTMMRNGTPRQKTLLVPWQTIEVRRWSTLEDVDTFFVLAPEELSVEDVTRWDEFDTNLNAKLPREEEWRVQRDPRGRGATVGPANYPLAVLWDGEYDPDPLTFYLGDNLETGERQVLTLGEVSPHVAVSGGTSSGKTSAAEIMAAQCLIKPMPWDPELHGMVVIVDPKGPFARRWAGRPGVVVANGQEDAAEPDEDGNPITGVVVMANCMQWLEVEHQRRQSILKHYPDVGTWVHLPDEVKRKERFFPILVVLDEYIDHTDKEKANGDERIEAENAARDVITRLAGWHARKYRNVGMHTILIAQEVKMTGNTGIGSALMRQLPVRIITGQMDPSQLMTMFGTNEVPNLPATRVVIENGERRVKTIPGRARVMNALGQQIHKVQVMWFGGSTNMETLDKWLPRGEIPPNGDFSQPTGRPRSREDFDAEGNYIGTDQPKAVADSMEDLPMDTNEPSARDFDLSDVPDDLSDVLPDDEAWGERPTDVDPEAVFPAAEMAAPRCSQEGCVNDADQPCASCRQGFCQYHLVSSPDPSQSDLLCPGCSAGHPLSASGLTDAYRRMHEIGRDAGLVASYAVQQDGTVIAVLRTPRSKKVIEVRGDGERLVARSRSGEVEGEEVFDRIETAVSAYSARRTEAAQEGAS